MFSKAPTDKQLLRDSQKDIRGGRRELEREVATLKRKEAELEVEIKKQAKLGNKPSAIILAKQLMQIRKQQQRLLSSSTQLGAVSSQLTVAHSSSVVAKSMGTAAKTMAAVNARIPVAQIASTMAALQRETARAELGDDMMADSLDAIFDDADADADADEEISKVFDEIGLDVQSQLASTPRRAPASASASASRTRAGPVQDLLDLP